MQTIKIHSSDNVLVAVSKIEKDTLIPIENKNINAKENISPGHKVAATKIKRGMPIIKYGCTIGIAKKDIDEGEWVHVHNVSTTLSGIEDYTYNPLTSEIKTQPSKSFFGFKRENGVGVRNEIWIIPTVGCVNGISKNLEKTAKKMISGSVSDVLAFAHPYGCSQLGDDQEYTRKILANMVNHPNAGAVLVLGLGCENSGVDTLKKYIGKYDPKRVKFLVCQESEDEISDGLDILEELISYAAEFNREEISAEHLVIGLKCGGSDGFSGITANPVVGAFSDALVSQGGTTVLTEVPEMFGAEQLLMNRAKNEEVFEQTVCMINHFKQYYEQQNMPIYENPSPGNKEGGITTLEDKSLGCTQKSGSAVVSGVLEYGGVVINKGLNLLSAPGNDLVASTALAAAGAQIVLFTTGRGTPFACPVPTVKISSNSSLYKKKNNWIDFDCGSAADTINKHKSIEQLSEELMDYILRVASGEQVKSEAAGYQDISIFKIGVTL